MYKKSAISRSLYEGERWNKIYIGETQKVLGDCIKEHCANTVKS